MEKSKKRIRIGDERSRRLAFALHGVSKQRIRAILAAAGDTCSADALYNSTRSEAASLLVTERMECSDGSTFEWELFDPTLLVQHVLSKSEHLASVYAQKMLEKPMAWHIVIGYDELVPVDRLKIKNLRKSMVVAFNFLELGQDVLEKDNTWFVPIVVRSTKVETFNWSAGLRVFLNRLMLHPLSPRIAGIPLTIRGVTRLLYATVSDIVTDGDGHKIGQEWNGASGLKNCFIHSNVFAKDSRMECGNIVTITCHNPTRFMPTVTEDVYDQADLVLAGRRRVREGMMTNESFSNVLFEGAVSHGAECPRARPARRCAAETCA